MQQSDPKTAKGKIMEKDTYRFDQYDSVFKYDADAQAYIFTGKLNGRTEEEFISDYENMVLNEQ